MLCQTSEICEWFRIICVVNLCSCICCCFFLLFDSTENVIIFKWHFRFCMLLLLLCMLLIGTLLLLLSFKYPLLICIIFVLSGLVYAFCFQLKCNCFFFASFVYCTILIDSEIPWKKTTDTFVQNLIRKRSTSQSHRYLVICMIFQIDYVICAILSSGLQMQ